MRQTPCSDLLSLWLRLVTALTGHIPELVGSYSKRHAVSVGRSPYAFNCTDADGFRIYFTPLAGVLFTVPSRYCALSVTGCSWPWGVGSPASHPIARVGCYSRTLRMGIEVWSTRLSRSVARCSKPFRLPRSLHVPQTSAACNVFQPPSRNAWLLDTGQVWACPISLATTLGTILLPRPTEMFQFSRFPPSCDGTRQNGWVAPFGDAGITGCSHLPPPFRSVATSFLGIQRLGIHRLRIMSSGASHLRRTAAREVPPPVASPWSAWSSGHLVSIIIACSIVKVHS